jgi:predicted transcriptional regulator
MGKKTITADQIKNIKRMRTEGISCKEIAAQLGVKPFIVSYYSPKRYKIKRASKNSKSNPKSAKVVSKDEGYYKAKYKEAVKILLENDLIDLDDLI